MHIVKRILNILQPILIWKFYLCQNILIKNIWEHFLYYKLNINSYLKFLDTLLLALKCDEFLSFSTARTNVYENMLLLEK